MDTKILKTIEAIPEYLQIIFVTGYIGYVIAQSGFREKEKKSDLFYGTLLYGLFGYIIYDLMKLYCPKQFPFVVYALSGSSASIIAAILWRKWIKNIWYKILHITAISNEDNIPTVWAGIIQNTEMLHKQISVSLKNGSKLECNDIQSFQDAPFPCYYADNDGNIAIYVTEVISSKNITTKREYVRDKEWGDLLTYIPKDEISKIAIRLIPK